MSEEVKEKNIITRNELKAILFAIDAAQLGVKLGVRLNATLRRSLDSVAPKIRKTLEGIKK